MSCQGQTKLTLSKQLYIQNFIRINFIDILLCQETRIENDTFKRCDYLQNNFTIINNNTENEYGTVSLIKNNIQVQDVAFDTKGRVIALNTGNITIINIYPKAGTDAESRRLREELFANTIPNMLK